MPKVNPEILIWARETSGLSLDEAAKKIGLKEAHNLRPAERLSLLEKGINEPTRPLLLKMTKQYRRPLLTFYMSRKPITGDRGHDFRTLPDAYSPYQNALVDTLVRQVRARQSMVKAALIEEEEDEKLNYINIISRNENIKDATDKFQILFNINLEKFRSQTTIEKAFKYLRDLLEKAGIFVLLTSNLGSSHTDIDIEYFRGFALADEIAPFIIINKLDSKYAWTFTLLHEVVHLMLGETGISGFKAETKIEKFCNDVASEFLLPTNEAVEFFRNSFLNEASHEDVQRIITKFANERNISSSMVAYKLYRNKLLNEAKWIELSSAFRAYWIAKRKEQRLVRKDKETIIPYYTVKRSGLGASLVSFVDRMMSSGTLSTTKASKILDVNPKKIQKLFSSQISNQKRRFQE